MSQFNKLIRRIHSLDRNLRFSEIRKILESYGYVMRGPAGGSSHMTFRKAGRPPITIPVHEPVKRIYILMVREILENEELNDEND